MAAIDKMNEFYICLERFIFLSECHAPEDLSEDIKNTFQCLSDYALSPDIKKRTVKANKHFETLDKKIKTQTPCCR